MRNTLVIGVGNSIRGDDAIGLLAVRALRERGRLEAGVALVELEASLGMLIDQLEGWDRLIVLDAVEGAPESAGRLHRYSLDELRGLDGGTGARAPAYATHQVGLERLLAMADELGLQRPADVRVCAVEIPPQTGFAVSLSCAVREALPGLVDAARREIESE